MRLMVVTKMNDVADDDGDDDDGDGGGESVKCEV